MSEQESAVCYGVVSLLDEMHQAQVLDLWDDLQREFGLRLGETHIPHFTYHSAERYDLGPLAEVLHRRAAETTRFAARSTILGVVRAGGAPMFLLPLVRTRALSDLHDRLWPQLSAIASGIFERYSPEVWIAGIALTPDLERDLSLELLRYLFDRDLAWEIQINNLALLRDTGERQVLEYQLELRGG